ncbi:MAG: hypothetical protein KDA17_06290, partial [Candidatus Saccharibacteria bacterium]|nr:hypothetical protein [Candidatus Saccharibacteria bacterium]
PTLFRFDGFYVDETANKIYIEGYNPASVTLEVSNRRKCISFTNMLNPLTLQNLTFKRYADAWDDIAPVQIGKPGEGLGTVTLDNVTVTQMAHRGWFTRQIDSLNISDCDFSENGYQNIVSHVIGGSTWTNITANNMSFRAKWAYEDESSDLDQTGWASGNKISDSRDITIDTMTGNGGTVGLWLDYRVTEFEIISGTFNTNTLAGILCEKVANITITDCTLLNNQADPQSSFFWTSQLLLSAAGNVTVRGSTIIGCSDTTGSAGYCIGSTSNPSSTFTRYEEGTSITASYENINLSSYNGNIPFLYDDTYRLLRTTSAITAADMLTWVWVADFVAPDSDPFRVNGTDYNLSGFAALCSSTTGSELQTTSAALTPARSDPC